MQSICCVFSVCLFESCCFPFLLSYALSISISIYLFFHSTKFYVFQNEKRKQKMCTITHNSYNFDIQVHYCHVIGKSMFKVQVKFMVFWYSNFLFKYKLLSYPHSLIGNFADIFDFCCEFVANCTIYRLSIYSL